MSLSYGSYLQLNKILDAQKPLAEDEHDEMLFIIIHQTYELWFKQILHEAMFLNESFDTNAVNSILHTLHRMLTILKTLVGQIDILETMTPLSFASFRNRLQSSSGFQSYQFRLLEFYMGFKDASKMEVYPKDSEEFKRLEKELDEPSLFDVFLRFLHVHHKVVIPTQVLERDFREIYRGNSSIVTSLLEIYRQNSLLSQICERLVDWDEGLQEWRYRHVKMVERTIGLKMGTGGSNGVNYLRQSLFQPAFPDLWNVRQLF